MGRERGSIDSQLREDLQRLKFVGGEVGEGDQLTINLGRICRLLQTLELTVD